MYVQMPRAHTRLLGVAVAAVAAVHCAGAKDRPQPPFVGQLKIEGTNAVSPSAIEKKLVTREAGWWPWADEQPFDPVVWGADLRRIERFYGSRGYYGAEVLSDKVTPRPGSDEVDLRVQVREGEPYRLAPFTVEGLDELTPEARETLLDDLPLEAGEIFRESEWEAAKAQLDRGLRDLGHARAELFSEAKVGLESHVVTPVLKVRPGPRYRFGELRIDQGPDATVDPKFVYDQVRLAIVDEDHFSQEALEEAERRVFGMGVFRVGRVTAGEPDAEHGRIPVQVEVREGPFRTLRLGAGVGFDQVRQEAHLVGEWTSRNFLGGLRRLTLRGTAGWAFLPSTIAVVRRQIEAGPRHGPIYRATSEFEQPRLFEAPALVGQVRLESEKTLEPAYDAIGGRAGTGVVWRPHTTLSLHPSYNIQVYRLAGAREAAVASAPLVLGCNEDPCVLTLSYLEQIVAWDRRDDPLEPRSGHLLSLSLQEGGGPLGGDFSYLRVMPEARGFVSVGDDDLFTFAARLRVGALIPTSGDASSSPAVSRFYGGGAMSMRGFGMRRLSPLLLLPTEPNNDASRIAVPIGGNGLIEGSFEARTPVRPQLLAAAFVDFGTVTRERVAVQDVARMQWAGGLGIRYLSPVGPIRLDLAVRLPVGRPPPLFDTDGQEITYRFRQGGGVEPGTETGENIETSCFGIGGGARSWVRDGLCAIHISIGEAF